jgi:taurine--2-oxoglutarate transaminase
MGEVMKRHHETLKARHPSVGLTRSIGLFGILELVKSRKTMEPLAPFNGSSEPMKAVGKYLRDHGLYTFVRWHTIMTNPPLCINEEQLAEGFGIIDKALELADQAVA